MSNLATFLSTIKKKAGVSLLGVTLIAAPSGVALAHGYHDHRGDSRHSGFHRSNDDNDRRSAFQKTCDERQTRADQAVADYKAKAQERFNGLSAYLADLQAFVNNNNLSIDDYDEFNDAAMKAQAKAQKALDNISSPDINCDRNPRHDRQQIYRAEHQLKKAIKKFESSVKDLSVTIADGIKIS